MSFTRQATFATAALISYAQAQKWYVGDESAAAELFWNKSSTSSYPNADSGSTDLKWTITNQSFYDRDTADDYLQLKIILDAPVAFTDVVTFHIEYTAGTDNTRSKMCRDGFEATASKSATTDYWDVSVVDVYARSDTNEDCSTASDITTNNDFNNSVENDGQDWFVFETDAERADDDHLCTQNTAGTACT